MAFQTSCRSPPSFTTSALNIRSAGGTVLRRNRDGGAISKSYRESRWAGPDSRCVRASVTINSRREDGQPELMLRLARLRRLFKRASANPTSVSCPVVDTAGGRDSVELRMDHLDVRFQKSLSSHTGSRGRVQTVFRTTVKLYTVT